MWIKFKPAWLLALIGGMIFFLVTKIGFAAVTLIYFRAIAQDGQILLEWETATEIDNAGFFVNRSLTQNSGYTRISPFIPSEGDDLTGAVYQFYDLNVTNGVVYWYLLEAVSLDQSTEYYQPPISAIPGNPNHTATPTATGTISTTPSFTATPTLTPTRTRTPTATSVNTATPGSVIYTEIPAYPAPVTQSGSGLAQPATTPANDLVNQGTLESPTAGNGATATLIPLPEIAMVFPTKAMGLPNQPDGQTSPVDVPLSRPSIFLSNISRNIILFGLLLLVWLILGGLYLLSSRQFE